MFMLEERNVKVKKRTLLLLASFVWLIAGFNILRIGIESYTGHVILINITLSIFIFIIFWWMVFNKLVIKHTIRIKRYDEELQFILNFFDMKSFCIMAFMITFGLLIRNYQLLSNEYIAVFYTGLGSALFSAGLLFGKNYIQYEKAKL